MSPILSILTTYEGQNISFPPFQGRLLVAAGLSLPEAEKQGIREGRMRAVVRPHQQSTAFGLFPEWFYYQSAHGGKVGVLRGLREIINRWSSLP